MAAPWEGMEGGGGGLGLDGEKGQRLQMRVGRGWGRGVDCKEWGRLQGGGEGERGRLG
jgi:hypothetical protein